MALSKIMLVEDDPEDRELFVAALSRIKSLVKICFAIDGIDAMEQLSGNDCNDVQLILLDVNMPRMNGWEMLTRLKQDDHYREIPVIMLSTGSRQIDMENALKLGAVAYISKPAEFNHIVDLVTVIVNLPKDKVDRVLKDYRPK